jgi:cytochrome c5
MSGRCKACNAYMSDEDMTRKFPPDENGKKEYSNLCGSCHEEAVAVLVNAYREPDYDTLYESFTVPRMREDWS